MVAVLVLFRGGGWIPKNFAKHKSFSSKIVFFCKVDLICDDLLPFTTQNVFPLQFFSLKTKKRAVNRHRKSQWTKSSKGIRKVQKDWTIKSCQWSLNVPNRTKQVIDAYILSYTCHNVETTDWLLIQHLWRLFAAHVLYWKTPLDVHASKKSHPWRRIIDICFLLADIAFPHMIVALPFGKHGPCGLIWISVLTSASVSLYRRMCRSLTSELKSREEK